MLPFNERGYIPLFLLFTSIILSSFIIFAALNPYIVNNWVQTNPEYQPILVIKHNRIATESGKIQLIAPLKSASPSAQATDSATTPSPSPELTSEAGPAGDRIQTAKGDFIIQVVTLPINSTMITDTATDSDCPKDCPVWPLAEFVTKNGGVAGITGTFNCPADYEDCKDKKESFDFSVYNSRLKKWINESNLSWDGRSMIY